MFPLPDDIDSKISSSPNSGVCCHFVKVNNDWGIKAFRNEDNRDNSQRNQLEYAKYGLSPPCSEEQFKIGNWYCFATRVAEILICPSEYSKNADNWYKVGRENKSNINDWHSRADDAKTPEVFDDHVGNFGWYEDNFVLIDCGND